MKKLIGIAAVVSAMALGAAVGYKIATESELLTRVKHNARGIFHASKQRMDEMTEEVALKTAKVTKNPKINQDWVERQWKNINY